MQSGSGNTIQCVMWVVYMTCDWFLWRYFEIIEGSCVCVRAQDMYLECDVGREDSMYTGCM